MADTNPLTEKIPYNLFREPLEYLFADHVRQTAICALIYELSDTLESRTPEDTLSEETRQKVEQVTHYLDEELPLHIADEELDILPSLRARVRPEDGMDQILEQLGEEHSQDEKLSEELVSALKSALRAPASAPTQITDIAGRFAEAHCGHMKWENEVLLPLARKRLTPEDQKQIGRTMAGRRNVPYPG